MQSEFHPFRLIARNLAKLHTSLPFTKDEESIQPFFVRKIQSFLMELKDFSFEDNQKQKFFVQHFGNCEVLHDQMQQLVAAIGRLNSPLVFCHNDLLPKNIVYNSALSNQVKKTLHVRMHSNFILFNFPTQSVLLTLNMRISIGRPMT